MTRIAQRRLEVDHRVERAALADPGVDGLPLRLPFGRVEAAMERLVFERQQRPAEDLEPARVRPHGKLVQPGDHLLGGDHLLVGLAIAVADAAFMPLEPRRSMPVSLFLEGTAAGGRKSGLPSL
jgi:hypothetical protein